MPDLAFTRTGRGEPLVLLHGLRSSRGAWAPVVRALAAHFDVVAVDLPGFGDSEALPRRIEPTPAALAGRVAALLDELEITGPHLAGNSLGGWVALEIAKIRPVQSLTLLSPAGLWRRRTPFYCRVSLRLSKWVAQHAARPLWHLLRYRLARALVLGQTHGHPTRASTTQARAAVEAMGKCTGFEATLKATTSRHYVCGPAIKAPVTVAFGSRDLLLRKHQSRHLDELPPGTRTVRLPGCGHVPMSDDPAAVVAVISHATARFQATTREPHTERAAVNTATRAPFVGRGADSTRPTGAPQITRGTGAWLASRPWCSGITEGITDKPCPSRFNGSGAGP